LITNLYSIRCNCHGHSEGFGNDEGAAVVVCVPGGFDCFFAACAEEFKKGEPKMSFLVKLAAEYGIEFLSGSSC
jgi:hypothetical protein